MMSADLHMAADVVIYLCRMEVMERGSRQESCASTIRLPQVGLILFNVVSLGAMLVMM